MDNISTESQPIELVMMNSSLLRHNEGNILNLSKVNEQRTLK